MNPSEASGSWGEYFPVAMCPYGYNETNANDYFPLTKEQAVAGGFPWRDETEQTQSYLGPPPHIPEDIALIDDSICDQILLCEATGKPFKIIPQELKFYRQMGIPIPRRCFEARHRDRLARRNPRKLWNRLCSKCGKETATNYAPDRPETIWCNACYLNNVY